LHQRCTPAGLSKAGPHLLAVIFDQEPFLIEHELDIHINATKNVTLHVMKPRRESILSVFPDLNVLTLQISLDVDPARFFW